jgi:hypothetical protein
MQQWHNFITIDVGIHLTHYHCFIEILEISLNYLFIGNFYLNPICIIGVVWIWNVPQRSTWKDFVSSL